MLSEDRPSLESDSGAPLTDNGMGTASASSEPTDKLRMFPREGEALKQQRVIDGMTDPEDTVTVETTPESDNAVPGSFRTAVAEAQREAEEQISSVLEQIQTEASERHARELEATAERHAEQLRQAVEHDLRIHAVARRTPRLAYRSRKWMPTIETVVIMR